MACTWDLRSGGVQLKRSGAYPAKFGKYIAKLALKQKQDRPSLNH